MTKRERARSVSDLTFSENDDFEDVKKELKKFKIENDRRFWRIARNSRKRPDFVCDCGYCKQFRYFDEECVPYSVPDMNSPWFEAWNFHNRRECQEDVECETESKKSKNM
jgi:hypothetical protein